MKSQILRYILVGCSNTAVTWLTFTLLRWCTPASLVTASAAGTTLGLINSFVWQKVWVFRQPADTASREKDATRRAAVRRSVRQAILFLLCAGACWVLQTAVLEALVRCRVHEQIAFLCGMASYTVANYLLNRHLVFRVS